MGTLIKRNDEVKKFRSEQQENQKKEDDERKAAVEKKQEILNDLKRFNMLQNQAGLRQILTNTEHYHSARRQRGYQKQLGSNFGDLRNLFNQYIALAEQMHDQFIARHNDDPFVTEFGEFRAEAQRLLQELEGVREMFRISDARYGEELTAAMRQEVKRIELCLTTLFLKFLSTYYNQERNTDRYHEILTTLLDIRRRVDSVGIQAFTEDEWAMMQQINLYAVIFEPDRYGTELFDHAYDLLEFGATFDVAEIMRQLNEPFILDFVHVRGFEGLHNLMNPFGPVLQRVEQRPSGVPSGGPREDDSGDDDGAGVDDDGASGDDDGASGDDAGGDVAGGDAAGGGGAGGGAGKVEDKHGTDSDSDEDTQVDDAGGGTVAKADGDESHGSKSDDNCTFHFLQELEANSAQANTVVTLAAQANAQADPVVTVAGAPAPTDGRPSAVSNQAISASRV